MAEPAKRLIPLPMIVITSEGPHNGRVFLIDGAELILGRRSTCDLILDDVHVSRAHCSIRKTGGAILIQDLKSTSGTFINDEPADGPVALKHGDIVRFGVIEGRFEDRSAQMNGDDPTDKVASVENVERPLLSPRQLEVLGYLVTGLTNAEIATKLGVTERTIKAHCHEVFDRLGARNRTAAVAEALRLGVFNEPS